MANETDPRQRCSRQRMSPRTHVASRRSDVGRGRCTRLSAGKLRGTGAAKCVQVTDSPHLPITRTVPSASAACPCPTTCWCAMLLCVGGGGDPRAMGHAIACHSSSSAPPPCPANKNILKTYGPNESVRWTRRSGPNQRTNPIESRIHSGTKKNMVRKGVSVGQAPCAVAKQPPPPPSPHRGRHGNTPPPASRDLKNVSFVLGGGGGGKPLSHAPFHFRGGAAMHLGWGAYKGLLGGEVGGAAALPGPCMATVRPPSRGGYSGGGGGGQPPPD